MPDHDFRGKVAAVTGGGSGIGQVTAHLLASQGAQVAVLDANLAEVADPLLALHADVTDDHSVIAAIEQLIEHFGSLDILVNNAGVGAQGTVEDGDLDTWRHVLDVNLLGVVRTSRAALPHLRRAAPAAIVNTCSIVATAGLPERALYSASKGALLSLTRAMAADHIGEGIRVNCVTPGTVETPWITRLLSVAENPDVERAALEARQPTGELVDPTEVARAIAYLANRHSTSTTGSALPVDGGMDGLRAPTT